MNKIKSLMRVWGLCKPYQRYILITMVFIFIGQAMVTIQPIMFGRIVSSVTEQDKHMFLFALLGWIGLAMCKAFVFYVKEHFELKKFEFELPRHLSRISMRKFFSISMGQHSLGHSVIKRNVISKGEAASMGTVFQIVYEIVPIMLSILLPTIFLFVNVWQVGVCVLGAIIIFTTYTLTYNKRFVPKMRSLDTLYNKIGKKQGEFVTNVDVVYANAQEDHAREETDLWNAKSGSEGVSMWSSYLNWFYVGQWSIWLFMGCAIAVAGWLAFKGQLGTGMFVTVIWWISAALNIVTNISHIQRNLVKNIGPIIKYFKFLDYEPDISVPKNPKPLDNLQGKISFLNVSFAYSKRTDRDTFNDEDDEEGEKENLVEGGNSDGDVKETALNNISFTLDAGKRYAFVGRSGAGKSTLVGLILRAFDPQSGQVMIDGVDIRELDYRELRRNIGLVPQDVTMFDGTIKYNVAFGLDDPSGEISSETLDKVARLSRISEFVDKLEKGWDTMIGERGIKLSGGQRQRVGIARALIKSPHILIFDEATSSLDTENEAGIRQSIEEASVGKTTIIIAHRLATVKDADSILVFDEGKLVGQGTHEDLLDNNEYYSRLVKSQVIVA